MLERLLKAPGFLYEIGGKYYYLGKWICKECLETEATDCVTMYYMCRSGQEEPNTNMYFQKIRAFSDFALEVPLNLGKIKADMESLLGSLDENGMAKLEKQLQCLEEDNTKYCG